MPGGFGDQARARRREEDDRPPGRLEVGDLRRAVLEVEAVRLDAAELAGQDRAVEIGSEPDRRFDRAGRVDPPSDRGRGDGGGGGADHVHGHDRRVGGDRVEVLVKAVDGDDGHRTSGQLRPGRRWRAQQRVAEGVGVQPAAVDLDAEDLLEPDVAELNGGPEVVDQRELAGLVRRLEQEQLQAEGLGQAIGLAGGRARREPRRVRRQRRSRGPRPRVAPRRPAATGGRSRSGRRSAGR